MGSKESRLSLDFEPDKKLLSHLAHHLVGIFCHHTPTNPADAIPEGAITASGFILEITEDWFLATSPSPSVLVDLAQLSRWGGASAQTRSRGARCRNRQVRHARCEEA
jgi:hypothetical protein